MPGETVPFLDVAAINARLARGLADAMAETAQGGRLILGQSVSGFEAEFASLCSAKHAVGVGCGLDALTLMLHAQVELGRLGRGDEVIVPANTYIATALAVSACGLVPVPAEPDETTHNIGAEQSLRVATAKTKAVLAVHLYGQLAPMQQLRELCDSKGWILMSDAAQAAGADPLQGGAWGACAGFSFYPSKNLGALGDGGAVVTDDERLAEIVRSLRNYGSGKKYLNDLRGVNSRLDEIQAAMLLVKLPKLHEDNSHRRSIAERYAKEIKHPGIILPKAPPHPEEHVWHLYVVRCAKRDALQKYLEEEGIETLIHYPVPPHKQKAYADTPLANAKLPLTEQLANEILSLPISPVLSDEQAGRVIEAVNSFSG